MIIILRQGITPSEKDKVRSFLTEKGFMVKEIVGENDTVFGAVGTVHIDPRQVELLPGVSSVVPISKPYKLASRELKKEDMIVSVGKFIAFIDFATDTRVSDLPSAKPEACPSSRAKSMQFL